MRSISALDYLSCSICWFLKCVDSIINCSKRILSFLPSCFVCFSSPSNWAILEKKNHFTRYSMVASILTVFSFSFIAIVSFSERSFSRYLWAMYCCSMCSVTSDNTRFISFLQCGKEEEMNSCLTNKRFNMTTCFDLESDLFLNSSSCICVFSRPRTSV